MIRMEQCGFMTTLQDLGRKGMLQWGVGRGGAMDALAAATANVLVLNEMNTVVLEITQSPHRLYTDKALLVAFAGGGLQPVCNGTALLLNVPYLIPAGSIFEMLQPLPGYRLYMAVAGGFESEEIFGSCSTDLLLKAGGYAGRTLRKGDLLKIRKAQNTKQQKMISLLTQGAEIHPKVQYDVHKEEAIAVMPGPEWNLLTGEQQQSLLHESFTISIHSNRMGYRLNSEHVSDINLPEIISSPVTEGTVQLTPSGELLVLMADGQTVGGYPRILQVASAHLPQLAQCRPGEQIRFRCIAIREAANMLRKQQETLGRLQQTMQQRCDE